MDDIDRQRGAPGWWFGAPLIGVLFGFVANSFFPEFVPSAAEAIYRATGNGAAPAAVPPEIARFLAPLLGIVMAVAVLAAWQIAKRARRVNSR